MNDNPFEQNEYETELADWLARRDAKLRKLYARRSRRIRRQFSLPVLLPWLITYALWAAFFMVIGMLVYRDTLVRACAQHMVLHDHKTKHAAVVSCTSYHEP